MATDRDDRRLAAPGDLELIRDFVNTLDVLPDTDKIGDPPEDRGEHPGHRPTFDDPSGRKVAVERIDTTAAMLKEEGAVPVPVEDLSAAEMPVAAYEWQLKAWGFESTGVELPEEKHVMAVPLGENGWLVELERFLRVHRDEARELLREETS